MSSVIPPSVSEDSAQRAVDPTGRGGPSYRLRVRAAWSWASSLALVALPGTAEAAANNACPAPFETISVAQAVSEGYTITPVLADSLGSRDGIVCRIPLGDGILIHLLRDFPIVTVDQIYFWLDNAHRGRN